MLAGLAISPQTPASAITDEAFHAADMILVMTVHPGAGGQKFMSECLEKVKELRQRFPEVKKHIQVDGGVGPGNVCECAKAGECMGLNPGRLPSLSDQHNMSQAPTSLWQGPQYSRPTHLKRPFLPCESLFKRLGRKRRGLASGISRVWRLARLSDSQLHDPQTSTSKIFRLGLVLSRNPNSDSAC